MNYGYLPTPFDRELWKALLQYVATSVGNDQHGMKCYVELDAYYTGVRIRRITHYTDDEIKSIVEGADKVYKGILEKHGVTEADLEKWQDTIPRPPSYQELEQARQDFRKQNR